MVRLFSILVWILAILAIPALILEWATCSQKDRIRKLRALGWTQQKIADFLKISRYQVRKALVI